MKGQKSGLHSAVWICGVVCGISLLLTSSVFVSGFYLDLAYLLWTLKVYLSKFSLRLPTLPMCGWSGCSAAVLLIPFSDSLSLQLVIERPERPAAQGETEEEREEREMQSALAFRCALPPEPT